MKNKYSHVFDKLEQTRKTLKTAQERIDRQNEIHNQVKSLRDRADVYADKLNLRSNNGEAKDMLFVDCPDFDFPQPLINYAEEEEKERQMEEERKLLLAVSNSQGKPRNNVTFMYCLAAPLFLLLLFFRDRHKFLCPHIQQ